MDTLHIPWIDMKRRELDFDFPVPALTCDSFKQGNMRYTTTQIKTQHGLRFEAVHSLRPCRRVDFSTTSNVILQFYLPRS